MRVNLIQNFSNNKTIMPNRSYGQGLQTFAHKNTAVYPVDTFSLSFGSIDIETLVIDLEEKKYRSYKSKNDAMKAMKDIAPVKPNDLIDGKLINDRFFVVIAERVKNPDGKLDGRRLAESVKNAKLKIEKSKPVSYGAFYLINETDVIKCDTPEDGAKIVGMKPGDFRSRMKQNPKTICGYAIVFEEKLLGADGKIDENKVLKARKILETKKQRKPSSKTPVYVFMRGKEPERFDGISKAALELEIVPATIRKALEEDGFIKGKIMIVPAGKIEDENGAPIPEKIKEAKEMFAKMQSKKRG